MILLVVGLVAVIVVILIAVFLSIRLGRGDEHDDEPKMRPSGRDRRAEEDRWREPDTRDTRRVPHTARAAGRGERNDGTEDRRRASEPAYAGRGAAGSMSRDRDRGSGSAGPATPRSAGSGPTTPPYDTGPRRAGRGDPAEYRGSPARRRSPAPAPAPVAAEGRSRHDTGPSRRVAADASPPAGYPAAGHPSMDFPAPDYSSGELPSVPARAGKPRPEGGRSDSRRKPATAPAPSKSRAKPHRGKRDDDDDWPTTEWDKLSDEQYWAELSADKPLATMARPASNGRARADEPAARDQRAARKQEEPARAGAAGRRSSGQPQAEREYDHEPRGRRERSPQTEPVTERLPVRSRQQPAVPAARLAAEAPNASRHIPASSHPSLDTGPYTARDGGRHPSLDTGLPLPVAGGTGAHSARDGSRHLSLDTGPRPARDADLAMLTGLASTPRPRVPGALDDDPLTSPSFSLKEVPPTDSRSYGHARKNAQPGSGYLGSDPLTRDGSRGTPGRESGGYAAGPDPTTPPYLAGHAGPGYAYPAEPAAAAAQWYAAPPAEPAPAPEYGNPYSYPSPGTGSPAGYAPDAGHGSYLADPLRVYSPPTYEPPVSAYPDPSSAPYQPHPAPGVPAQSMEPPEPALYQGPYPEYQYGPGQGQPEPAQYQDGYAGAGYTPGYENGYGGDPYAGGGFGSYQPQG
jgi:hypothetical protein